MSDATTGKSLVPNELIATRILQIRDQKVMIDTDIAEPYGVTTKRLNEQVKRNINRFPPNFMFDLTKEEKGSGGRKLQAPRKIEVFTGFTKGFHRTRNNDGRQRFDK